MPVDAADYAPFVRALNLFETVSLTAEDSERTAQYQQEAERKASRGGFVNEDEYLASLEMVCKIEPFSDLLIPRVAQLTQRSNQFNLRTVRYGEAQLRTFAVS